MSTPARSTLAGGAVTALLLAFAPDAAAVDGAALYKSRCALCHGSAPAPRFAGRSADDVKKAIAEGKGQMKPIALEAGEAEAIASLVADPTSAATPAPAPGPNPAALQKIAKGDELAAAKDQQLALYAYLDAINLDPRNVQARLKLAAQYARMGHPQQAAQQWELALALDPGNEEAARNLRSAGGSGR